ncbi:MAG TPA: hypothetical protein VLK82_15695 [Candidatus Tectomicrobia bacterium]|nr:hypothetical protein [Candidatus Tectomicrobia bacterium]
MHHDADTPILWCCCVCDRPLFLGDICLTRVVRLAGEIGVCCTVCCDCEVHRAMAQDTMPGTVIWRRREDPHA